MVQIPITPKTNLGRVAEFHDALVRASVDDEDLENHWTAIEKRENAARAAEIRRQWVSYYERLAESYRRYAEEHQQRAEALLEGERR